MKSSGICLIFAVKRDYHIINRMDVGQDPLFSVPSTVMKVWLETYYVTLPISNGKWQSVNHDYTSLLAFSLSEIKSNCSDIWCTYSLSQYKENDSGPGPSIFIPRQSFESLIGTVVHYIGQLQKKAEVKSRASLHYSYSHNAKSIRIALIIFVHKVYSIRMRMGLGQDPLSTFPDIVMKVWFET